jgi:hypothetical protein
MDFGKIISNALKVTWEKKVLWLFAILPTLVFVVPFLFFPTPNPAFAYRTPTQREIVEMSRLLLGWLALMCFLVIGNFAIGPITVGGIIKGIQLRLIRKSNSLGSLLRETLRYYWRLFLLQFVPIAINFLAAIIVFLFTSLVTSFDVDFITITLGCVGGLAFVFGLILLAIEMQFANIAVIVHNLGVGEALSEAWRIIRTKTGPVILSVLVYGFLGFVLFVIYYAVNFGISTALIASQDLRTLQSLAQVSNGWIPYLLQFAFYIFWAIAGIFFHALWIQTFQVLSATPVTRRRTLKTPAKKKAVRRKAKKS